MFRNIVAEMIRFLMGSGLECDKKGDNYEIRTPGSRWRRPRMWRMRVTDGDVRQAMKEPGSLSLDVFLSLFEIPDDVRDFLCARNTVWIDVAKKQQPRVSNELGDEVLSFLKRYGIRTLRYPPISASSRRKEI